MILMRDMMRALSGADWIVGKLAAEGLQNGDDDLALKIKFRRLGL